MQRIWQQFRLFLLMQAITLAAYTWVPTLPLWSMSDLDILHDVVARSSTPFIGAYPLGYIFSQPLLNLAFFAQYKLFGLEISRYFYTILVIHAINAQLVVLLVRMLFSRFDLAVLAGVLFATSVGNYGKILLSISGLESVLLGLLYLLVLYCLIRDDFKYGSRLTSPWYIAGVILFLMAGLTKPASLSILGCFLAYKFLFFKERGSRGIFSANVLILMVIGLGFFVAKSFWGYSTPDGGVQEPLSLIEQVWYPLKNIFRYLNLLVFPMQVSTLLDSAHPLVQLVYDWRLLFRTFTTIGIISFSFFGLVFGSKALRFFIAWTFITVLPFAIMQSGRGWLNLSYLYLGSIGFCVVLSVGTLGFSGLLKANPWKRALPFIIPAFFIFMSLSINYRLAKHYRIQAQQPAFRSLVVMLENNHEKSESSIHSPK